MNEDQINIFIVEDNQTFALALKVRLENAFTNKPIQFHLFETGEACMDNFKEILPQIVILDYALNSKYLDAADGIEVLDWIKKINDQTFVIMLTWNDNIETAIKSIQHKASDYITKTDTKFEKIIFSLNNLFEIIKAKSDAAKYLSELNEFKENYLP